MLKELLSIFRSGNPMAELGANFAEMLRLAEDLTVKAGAAYFGAPLTPEDRTALYRQDIEVNKLERRIRKRIISYLSAGGHAADLPYCLLLMSLVKDVERIGDYAKNVVEAREFLPAGLPDDARVTELKEIRGAVEGSFRDLARVFEEMDREEALARVEQGRAMAQRAEALVGSVARSSYDPATVTSLVLTARFYKRIGGHILNILSSVTMPLHKLDYYDERELSGVVDDDPS